jgi:hypothetical protein
MSPGRWEIEVDSLKKSIRAKQPIQAVGGSKVGKEKHVARGARKHAPVAANIPTHIATTWT